MKKAVIIVLLLFWTNNYPQPLRELRGVWITNVDSYILYSDKSITDGMEYLSKIGINVIFPVVWNKGYTLYPSQVMQEEFGAPIIPVAQFQNRDPLDRIILEAHIHGIEVIPWFEFGFSPSYSLNGGHILAKYPQWGARDATGNLVVKNGFDWMAGTNPEVQNFLLSLITEVADKYDIDGVQGDDRLPAMPSEGGYDSVTVEIYKAENNGNSPPTHTYNADWMRWRANKLNDFFRRMRDSVKARGEHLIISSAPSVYPWGYQNYLQDNKSWVDSGIVDNYIPQLYRDNFASYSNEVNTQLNYISQGKRDIFFAGMLIKAGTYLAPIDYLINGVSYNRTKNVKGETYFFYEGLRAENGIRGDTLSKRFYSQSALLPYRNGNIFRPKAKILNEEETGVVRVGNWYQLPVVGYKPNIYRASDSAYASITYNFQVPFSAWFSVYAYQVPNFIFTSSARYLLYSGADSTEVIFNQSDQKNSGWRKIGDVFLSEGYCPVLKLDNTLMETGKYLLADAVMIMINRKLSPDVVVTSLDEKEAAADVSDFELLQNYPNPFNPITKIDYSLPSWSRVSIVIYDIMGREIEVIKDSEEMEGKHQIIFDGTHLSSGVYFCQIRHKAGSKVVKMVLMK